MLSTGTIFWASAELALQLSGIRDFDPMYIFRWEIPLWIQIPIQGITEGAFVAVTCMFIGDRIIESKKYQGIRKYRWDLIFSCLLFLLVLDIFKEGIKIPNVGGDVSSRRSMLEVAPLIFLSAMVIIDIIFFKKADPNTKKRGIYLLALMIIFSAVWTISEVISGNRWIEVGNPPIFERANPFLEFIMLTFDVVVEIALAYIPFLAIPYFLGHIQSKRAFFT
jgi:hypothetical protein